jgi:hypothetical protein
MNRSASSAASVSVEKATAAMSAATSRSSTSVRSAPAALARSSNADPAAPTLRLHSNSSRQNVCDQKPEPFHHRFPRWQAIGQFVTFVPNLLDVAFADGDDEMLASRKQPSQGRAVHECTSGNLVQRCVGALRGKVLARRQQQPFIAQSRVSALWWCH